jgi:predicted nucleotidyltransferase
MTTKENILNALKSRKLEFSNLGIKNVGLFGSYARNEQVLNSDIDVLVDFNPDDENFDNLMAVYDIIEELFHGEKIEVVTLNGLSPYIEPSILNEVQYV